MNLNIKSLLMIVGLIQFAAQPVRASNYTPPSILASNIQSVEIKQVAQYCIVIPYSGNDIARKWDIIMALHIEWLIRENIPYHILKSRFRGIEYYSPDTSQKTLACFFYEEPLVMYR